MPSLACLSASLLAIVCTMAGCSSPAPPEPEPKASAGGTKATSTATGKTEQVAKERVAPAIHEIDLQSLPKVETFSPPLDEGRVTVPFLPEWSFPPRSSEWLFRWKKNAKDSYPIIFLTVHTDLPLPAEQLSKSNAGPFAEAWHKLLAPEHDAKSFAEFPRPIQLGTRYAVECQLYSSTTKLKLTRHLVVVVEQGRMYQFEMRAIRDTAQDYRPALYAAVAGLKAHAPAATPAGNAEPTAEGATPAEDTKK